METKRKGRGGKADSRTLLLDITEQLILDEGYAAVTTRRVAKIAEVTSAAVHYHFPTTDDLLIAVYRRTIDANLINLREALASKRPLHALWNLGLQGTTTALGLEFMAMANHRKAIRNEIARYAEYSRGLQTDTLAQALQSSIIDLDICPPESVPVLLTGIYRVLIMENGLGCTTGHEATRKFMEWLLDRIEPESAGES